MDHVKDMPLRLKAVGNVTLAGTQAFAGVTGSGLLMITNESGALIRLGNATTDATHGQGIPDGALLPIPVADVAALRVWGAGAISWSFWGS